LPDDGKAMIKPCKTGIWFSRNGDEVEWIFPWRRNKFKNRFLSLSFEDCYSSLKELDKEWDEWWKAETEAMLWDAIGDDIFEEYGDAFQQLADK
jgi:hypothetical protein